MHIAEIEWDEGRIEHIARHQVSVREVEEVCFNPGSFVFRRKDRYIVLGQTEAGRYLFVAVKKTRKHRGRVITARDMDEKERKRFKKQRR